MKILHTADLHLREPGDERWAALESILELARREGVGLVAIAGDLYDRAVDVGRLRVPVRELLDGQPFEVVVIPGNHDVRAMREGDFYGGNVLVFHNPRAFRDIAGVRVFGLPFENVEDETLLRHLAWIRAHRRQDACNILLYHGELIDALFERDDFGDEEHTSYMPSRLSYFQDAGIDYVLAGHFHSRFEVRRFGEGYFVYPGSPASVTRKETGRRKVNIFAAGEAPHGAPLDTAHYETLSVTLSGDNPDRVLNAIDERIEACHRLARVMLTIDGLVDLGEAERTETDLAGEIEHRFAGRTDSISQRWIDVGDVLRNDIYRRCAAELDNEACEDEASQRRVRRLLLESIAEAQHAD